MSRHYGYRIEVYEYDVDGEPCDVREFDSDEEMVALIEAHERIAEGASSAVIQLVTTWRELG